MPELVTLGVPIKSTYEGQPDTNAFTDDEKEKLAALPTSFDKSTVGLGNVDNTSDIDKPISDAAQTALNLKVDETITVNGQPLSSNVEIDAADLGLGNVDNTSDIDKPISDAAQTALGALASDISDLISDTVLISANTVINAANADDYDGNILEFAGAFSITLSADLPVNFGCGCIPPVTGNASIVSAGGVLLNGATTTLTRAAASNSTFAIVQRQSVATSYIVTGQ